MMHEQTEIKEESNGCFIEENGGDED